MDINRILSALKTKLEECKQKEEELYSETMKQDVELEDRIHKAMDFHKYRGKCEMLTFAINLINVSLFEDKWVDNKNKEK